ncbi:MAG: radical SAM protein [Thermodesulfovibrionales bacterium]|nr:radical SAM protein [Thermodesulfovibrionales bacterium]
MKWEITSIPNLLNMEKIELIARHGCERVKFWTADSGDDAILQRANKPFTTSQLREACEQIKKYGMETFAAFLFGYPGEDANSCKRTLEFAKKLNLDSYWFGIPKPFPGSGLYQMGLAMGKEIIGNWKEYFMNPEEPPKLPVIGCDLDPWELFGFMSTARRQLPVVF